MAVREFLWIIKESAYGTPKASPVAGTDSIYIRLDGGNNFTMRAKPKFVDVKRGGGLAINAVRVRGESPVSGSLNLKLCYSQSLMLLNWAATRINVGQTSPWVTTEIEDDLASCTIYHGFQRSTGVVLRKKYSGAKVSKAKIDVSKESLVASLSLDLIAQKVTGDATDATADPNSTEFPAPAETAYPTDLVSFQHSAAGLIIANSGTARTSYSSLSIDIANKMDMTPGAGRWLEYLRFFGRETKLTTKLILKPSPDDRAAYEALTAQAVSVAFTNGTNTITLDFKGTNYHDEPSDDLPIDNLYEQTVNLHNLWNVSAATDFSFAYA